MAVTAAPPIAIIRVAAVVARLAQAGLGRLAAMITLMIMA